VGGPPGKPLGAVSLFAGTATPPAVPASFTTTGPKGDFSMGFSSTRPVSAGFQPFRGASTLPRRSPLDGPLADRLRHAGARGSGFTFAMNRACYRVPDRARPERQERSPGSLPRHHVPPYDWAKSLVATVSMCRILFRPPKLKCVRAWSVLGREAPEALRALSPLHFASLPRRRTGWSSFRRGTWTDRRPPWRKAAWLRCRIDALLG
jgi:hypothetical protein